MKLVFSIHFVFLTAAVIATASAFVATSTTSTTTTITTTTRARSIQGASPHIASRIVLPATANEQEEETEVERLLRKAKELRAQAEHDEEEIHSQLSTKKSNNDAKLDGLIHHFLCDACDSKDVVDRMHAKQVSMETLEQMIDRLDDRQAMAEGREHVGDDFQRTRQVRDDAQVQELQNMLTRFLEAVQVLDDEFQQSHNKKSTGGVAGDATGSLLYSVSHAEAEHWGGGHASQYLKQRLKEKQRARDEQYEKRQQEFHDAQSIKKNSKQSPPPKVKDDHGFL